jgi:hypothetical protein
MIQTCFGCSGGFGPISLPLFQGLRGAVTALVSLTVCMVLLPFLRRRPSILLRRNGGPALAKLIPEPTPAVVS